MWGCSGSEDEDGEHIPYSPLSGEEAGEAVQLTMVLYHQEDYNRARRWRLPKCTLSPGEYQVNVSASSSLGIISAMLSRHVVAL